MALNSYTAGWKHVMRLARIEASLLGHDYVAPEHFLLGILRKGEGLAHQILLTLAIDVKHLKDLLVRSLDKGREPFIGIAPHTASAAQVVESARKISEDLSHAWIGTEHLLLALLTARDTLPARVLHRFQVNYDTAKQVAIALIEGTIPPPDAMPLPQSASPSPHERPYTPGWKEALRHSRNEAGRFGHDFIAPEHLLLGIIRAGSGLAIQALDVMEIEPMDLKLEVEREMHPAKAPTFGILPQNPDSNRVIKAARDIAAEMNQDWVGSEHLLLALIRTRDTLPYRVLQKFGMDFVHARVEVWNLTGGQGDDDPGKSGPIDA